MQDLNDKTSGSFLLAPEWNQIPSEMQNIITDQDITLSSGDLNQLGKAIAGYVGNATFYTDSGIADAYVLTTIGSKQSITAYTNGLNVNFIAGNTNTGASTVNVAGLGVKNIKLGDGTDPIAGDISGRIELAFDSSNDRFELLNPVFSVNVPSFDSVAQMKLSSLAADTDALTSSYTSGWAATLRGPVGGSRYSIVTKAEHDVVRGTGTVDEKIDHTLANTNVALLQFDGVISLTQAGGTVTLADNGPIMQAIMDVNPSALYIPGDTSGSYTFTTGVTGSDTIDVYGDGDKTVIDNTASAAAWLTITGAALTQIEELGANANEGDPSVTFASAPSLVAGEVFLIFNPTNSSFSGFRTSYHAGEYCEVESVSASVAKLKNQLYDDYIIANVDVYKQAPISPKVHDLKILGSTSADLVVLERCINPKVYNYTADHSNNSGILFRNCYKAEYHHLNINNEGDGGDDYGINIANCQDVIGEANNIFARRHAVNIGGGSQVGAVPSRNIRNKNSILKNDLSSGVHCADFHGNVEDSTYEGCAIYGGGAFQGKNNGYVDCTITEMLFGGCILAAEILGGDHYLDNCRLKTYTDPQPGSRGIVDIGGQSSVITANTTEDVNIRITGGKIFGRNIGASTIIILTENDGSTSKLNVEASGIHLDLDNFGSVVGTVLNTGAAASDFMIADKLVTGLTGKLLFNHAGGSYTNFPHRCQAESGQETVLTDTGASFVVGTAVVYKWSYPRKPPVTMCRSAIGYITNRIGIAHANPTAATGMTPAIATDDGTNFGGASNVDLNWRVGIEEV